jgi:hypothetical protein
MADRRAETVNQKQRLTFTANGVLDLAIAPRPGMAIESEAIKNGSHRR